MSAGIVTTGVILQALGGYVRKPKRFPPQILSLRPFVILTGTLLLCVTAFLPQANAEFCPPGADCQLVAHWNFNSEINGQPPPYPSEETTGPPATAPFLFNDPNPNLAFPPGNINVVTGVGTVLNGGGDPAGGALDVRGNTQLAGHAYCFDIGPINVSGLTSFSVSFALQSLGNIQNPGQFNSFTLSWGTNGTTWTAFSTQPINQDGAYHVYNGQFTVPAGTTTIFLQFCFTGSTNNAEGNHTYIDNIEVDAVIPEPATVIGGVLGVLGLCWHQRRRLRLVLPRLRKV